MEWPPQNTGRFAPAICIGCPEILGKVEFRSKYAVLYVRGHNGYTNQGIDGTYYQRITYSGSTIQEIYEPILDEFGEIIQECGTLLSTYVRGCTGYHDLAVHPDDPTGETLIDTYTVECFGPDGHPCVYDAYTDTTYTATGCDGCQYRVDDGLYEHTTGASVATLSGLKTPEDAVARFKSEAEFTPWEIVIGEPPVAVYHLVRVAIPTNDGYRFTYSDVEWRVTSPNLIPGEEYSCKMKVYRRVEGTYEYAHYADTTETATADYLGTCVFQGTVPNDAGYDTYVDGVPVVEPS